MSAAARRVPWPVAPVSVPGLRFAPRHARTGVGPAVAAAMFVPLWLPRPLLLGEFSLTFVLPFVLALWAMTRPAWPGSVRRAMSGGPGRGLWLELICVSVIITTALLSMLVSPAPLRALRVVLPMTYAFCTLILLSRTPPFLQRRLLLSVLFSGAAVLGVALLLSQAAPSLVMRDYRFLAFFENPNQLGIMVLAVYPLAIVMLLNADTTKRRLMSALTVLILTGAIFISGTKTALALGFVAGALAWIYHASRSGSLDKTLFKVVVALCAIVLAVPLLLWVLSWASPLFYKRVDSILTYGVWQFPSMKTRTVIWMQSMEIGLAHPLLGEGAGTRVYNYSHSHNMFADYFRGMGIFALVAVVVLVLSAVGRGVKFLLSTLRKGMTDRTSDTIVASLYLGAIFYLIANQLSDSFSPTTAYVFWLLYLGAYLSTIPETSVALLNRRPSTRLWTPRARRLVDPPPAASRLFEWSGRARSV